MDYTVEDAVLLHTLRNAGLLRCSGKRDSGGRWYPNEDEIRPCCRKVYPPSARYPNTLLRHCRTLRHAAMLLGVDYAAASCERNRPHWRVVKKILDEPLVECAQLPHDARPRIQEYAHALLQQAYEYADVLTDDEIDAFRSWIRQYCPEVDTIDWQAVRAMKALQQAE